MKIYELKQIATYLSGFKKLISAKRVDDTIIEFIFDKSKPIYANLKKGGATWYMGTQHQRQKIYQAPFDILLTKYFSRVIVKELYVQKGNRILVICVQSASHYKSQTYKLFLEFTGRNTNAIIVDEEDIVLEALRHIDKRVSFREVSVGEKLLPLPPREFREDSKDIEDIPRFLETIYQKQKKSELGALKRQKISILNKKLSKLQTLFDKLEDEETLQKKALRLEQDGTLILANLHLIKPYAKRVELIDFEGKKRVIVPPKESRSPQNMANIFFNSSKKMKQKVKFIHIQRENLQEKINFLKKLIGAVEWAQSLDEVKILVPKQQSIKKKSKNEANYETFFMEGYKIMVGKSQKNNIELLKISKKNDIWLHLKDIPSSHVIIRTDKQKIPENVLEFGAKMCVHFSTTQKDSYLVDYTKRQNVRIESGSNVFYTNFKTLKVDGREQKSNFEV